MNVKPIVILFLSNKSSQLQRLIHTFATAACGIKRHCGRKGRKVDNILHRNRSLQNPYLTAVRLNENVAPRYTSEVR